MNPFKYGQIVSHQSYCPRPQLEKSLKGHMESGQNVFVEGERRVGKSSLITHAALTMKEHRMVYIDIYQIKTVNDLISRITNALISLEKQAGLFEKVVKMVSHLRPSFSVDVFSGNPSLSFHTNETLPPENVEHLLDFLYEEHKNKKSLIILDEFQDILNLPDSEKIVAMMRSRIQFHSTMAYIFSGSVRRDMDQVFYDPDSPFFQSAIKLEVGLLSRDDFSKHLAGLFGIGNRTLGAGVLDKIYLESGERPGDVQELCNALWSITQENTVLTEVDVMNALETVFSREKEFYEQSVSGLTSNQLRCLVGVAHLGGKSVQSGTFLKFTGMLHASSVKKAVSRLTDLNILYHHKNNYIFNSPFLKTWLKHKNR